MVKAVCVLKGSGETTGTIYFEDSGSGSVSVTGEISGLADGLHGFHIHQVSYGCFIHIGSKKITVDHHPAN